MKPPKPPQPLKPGEQPLDPQNPPRFRPPDRASRRARETLSPRQPDPVDQQVQDCLGDRPLRFNAGQGVEIAVFDTWPLTSARTENDFGLVGGGHNHVPPGVNPFLDGANTGRLVRKSDRRNYVNAADAELPCSRQICEGGFEPPYVLDDHGLFIADIVKDIAPNATLRVYRVLNKWGSGDLFSIWSAVWEAIHKHRDPTKPLILNLSLGFGPQLLHMAELLARADDFFDAPMRWANEVAAAPISVLLDPDVTGLISAPAAQQRQFEAEAATLRRQGLVDPDARELRGPLEAIQHLFGFDPKEDRVLVVAAAGNDSCRSHGHPLPPRVPALIEGVLGVSAVGEDGHFASYSNDDDSWEPDDGISAYGGEVAADGYTADGLVGLYASDRVPSGASDTPGVLNDDGWVMWAGTSFATPIIAGLAACIWSEDPAGLTAEHVLHRIVFDSSGASRPSIPLRQQVFP